MKDIKQFIVESTETEDLSEEIGIALKEFGSIRHGFKMTPIQDIKDAMYKAGFDFDEEQSSDDKLVFVGEYINTDYEIKIYADDYVKGKIKIKNYIVDLA